MRKMSEFVSNFVPKWQDHINKMENTVCDPSVDLFVALESRITAREINNLIRTHVTSSAIANEATLQPFMDFLAKRRARIFDTPADYSSYYLTGNTDANLVCEKLAHGIARVVLDKPNVTRDEANKYLICGQFPTNMSTAEERQQLLRQRVAACLKLLFVNQAELIEFMVTNIQKTGWQEFIKCCDLSALKDFFLPPDFIKMNSGIYNAIAAKADDNSFYTDDPHYNEAKLFCLLEINKRQRELDPEYLGMFRSLTGIRGGRRVSQLQRLQDFIVSGDNDLDLYMQQFKADVKSLLSGHTKILANRTKQMCAGRNMSPNFSRIEAGM